MHSTVHHIRPCCCQLVRQHGSIRKRVFTPVPSTPVHSDRWTPTLRKGAPAGLLSLLPHLPPHLLPPFATRPHSSCRKCCAAETCLS